MASGSAPDMGEQTGYRVPYTGAPVDPMQDPLMGGSLNYGGTVISMNNPQNFTPDQLNPAASPYIAANAGLSKDLMDSSVNPFSDQYFNKMLSTNMARGGTALQNQMANMGLSGSSAEIGALGDLDTKTQLATEGQQMGEQLNWAKAMSGLNQTGFQDVMGVQNQYGGFEDAYNQSLSSLLGVQEQQNASNNAMWGQMISGMGQMGMSAAMLASDRDLKENIEPLSGSLEKIKKINGVKYEWKPEEKWRGNQKEIGVIAQDVQEQFPELVKKSSEGHLVVNYQQMTAPMIEAIKELSAKLDQANARIESLEKGKA